MGWPGCDQLPVEKWDGPWGIASFTLEPNKPLTDEDRKNADISDSYPSWFDGWCTFGFLYSGDMAEEYYADFTHAKEACADGRYYGACIYWMEPMTVIEALGAYHPSPELAELADEARDAVYNFDLQQHDRLEWIEGDLDSITDSLRSALLQLERCRGSFDGWDEETAKSDFDIFEERYRKLIDDMEEAVNKISSRN
mgnify:FL=1